LATWWLLQLHYVEHVGDNSIITAKNQIVVLANNLVTVVA